MIHQTPEGLCIVAHPLNRSDYDSGESNAFSVKQLIAKAGQEILFHVTAVLPDPEAREEDDVFYSVGGTVNAHIIDRYSGPQQSRTSISVEFPAEDNKRTTTILETNREDSPSLKVYETQLIRDQNGSPQTLMHRAYAPRDQSGLRGLVDSGELVRSF